MNKTSGNMYSWATHTVNFVGGECLHRCTYCYMKKGRMKALKKYQGPARLVEYALEDLGKDRIIFTGSATDMWGDWVKDDIIYKVLEHCCKYDNTYLFQTKNPQRYLPFLEYLPKKVILGTTIETNRAYEDDYKNKTYKDFYSKISKAPFPLDRVWAMEIIKEHKMVSIEPIIDFDVEVMTDWMRRINPEFVSIGADSKGSNLPEPPKEKIEKLICELSKFTKVKNKHNLNRILYKEV